MIKAQIANDFGSTASRPHPLQVLLERQRRGHNSINVAEQPSNLVRLDNPCLRIP